MDRDNFFKEYILFPLIKAWSFFYEIPFPFFSEYGRRIDSIAVNRRRVLFFIPLLGFITGFIAYMFVVIFYMFFGDIATTIISSILLIIAWEILNNGKDTNSLIVLIMKYIFRNRDLSEQTILKENNFMFFYLFIALFLIRMLALAFIIYYHFFSWIIVIPVLTLTLQAFLAAGYEGEFPNAFFVTDKNSVIVLWTIAGLICFFSAGLHLISLVATYCIILLAGMRFKTYLDQNNLLTNDTIGMAGKVAEIIILLTGIIFVIHF